MQIVSNIYFSCVDKNRAPGSVEAFKAVGNAVAILTDVEKRKSYDLYGSDERQNIGRNHHRGQYTQYGYSRGFEADVTAEELFNMFFGGGAFQQQNVYSTHSRRFNRNQQEEREVSYLDMLRRKIRETKEDMCFFARAARCILSEEVKYPLPLLFAIGVCCTLQLFQNKIGR